MLQAWGKTDKDSDEFHPLAHHSMDVAVVFARMLQLPVVRDRLEAAAGAEVTELTCQRLAALAFLHDIGKLHPGFQAKGWASGHWKGPTTGHLKESWAFLMLAVQWPEHPFHGTIRRMLDWGEAVSPLMGAMFAHHGRPVERPLTPTPRGWPSLEHYDWRSETRRMRDALQRWFRAAFEPGGEHLPHTPPFCHETAGLASLADWIGSDRQFFEFKAPFVLDYDAQAHGAAACALAAIGFDSRTLAAAPAPSFEELTDSREPNPAQAAVGSVDSDVRLVILEAETGSGKTEAALWRFTQLLAAGVISGLYFAVPTRAAARQLHDRVDKALRRVFGTAAPQAVLAIPGMLCAGEFSGQRLPHWRVKWDDDVTTAPQRWAAEHATRFLAAPVAVGTVDQAMLAGLQVKHAHLRGIALSRSLLVIDEVHASDAYMTEILKHLLDGHLATGGYAMLMSATLGATARARWTDESLPDHATASTTPYPAVWVRGEHVPREPMVAGRPKTVHPETVPTMGPAEAATHARASPCRTHHHPSMWTSRSVQFKGAGPYTERGGRTRESRRHERTGAGAARERRHSKAAESTDLLYPPHLRTLHEQRPARASDARRHPGDVRRATLPTSMERLDPRAMDTCSESKAALPSSGFLEEPLEIFRGSLDDCLDPDEPGMKKGTLFTDVLSEADAAKVPRWKPRRSEVFALAADKSVNVESVCATAMAWGGMNVGYWRLLWETSGGDWLNVARCIREGRLSRDEAYEGFRALKKEGKLKGMGPAFFTKLICFLTRRDGTVREPGYIMDRWAASSVNLLTGSNRVLLDGTRTWNRSKGELDVSYGFTVSDVNTNDDYEAFCTAVDRLAAVFCLCVDQVDCALFSVVGKRPGTWRRYVVAHGETLLCAMDRTPRKTEDISDEVASGAQKKGSGHITGGVLDAPGEGAKVETSPESVPDIPDGVVSRAQGCLLGQVAGDSLGSLVEFKDAGTIREMYPEGVRELADGGEWGTLAGQPTDDSEMALALARSLVRNGGCSIEDVRASYVRWKKSRPFDIGTTTRCGLKDNPILDSQANGALMRVSPLGIFGWNMEPEALAKLAAEDAAITHPNRICQQVNGLYATAIAEAIREGLSPTAVYDRMTVRAERWNVGQAIQERVEHAQTRRPPEYYHKMGWVLTAFQNALYELLHAPTLEEGVIATVQCGGDTDTNGAICGALLGAVYGRDAVPEQWVQRIVKCRPTTETMQPRPEEYWPDDVLRLAEDLLQAEKLA